MASVVQRELKITYGSLVIGDAEDLEPDGPFLLSETDDSFEARFAFVYSVPTGDATPEVTFATTVAAIELALHTRDLRLLIEYGADLVGSPNIRIDFNPSPTVNSALNVRATWEAERITTHTVRSVRYEVAVTGGLPATSTTGTREFSPRVTIDPCGVARVTFTGVVTALGANSASVQYDVAATVSTKELAYLAARFPGEIFELEESEFSPTSETEQLLAFTRTYAQLIDPQSANLGAGVLDDPDFKAQSLVITRERVDGTRASRGDGATPLVNMVASFSSCIDASVIANRGIPALLEKVDLKLVPFVAARMQEVVAGSTLAITAIEPDFDPKTNRVLLRVRGLAAAGGQLISRTTVTSDNEATGVIIRKLYPDGSEQSLGGPPSPGGHLFTGSRTNIPRAFRFNSAGTVRRTITQTDTVLGTVDIPAPAGAGGGGNVIPVGVGVGGNFGLDGPFENAFGIGVISEVGESFLVFEGPGGGGAGGGAGGAGGGGGGGVVGVVIDRSFAVVPAVRGIPGFFGEIEQTDVVSTVTIEFIQQATVASGGGGGREDDTRARNEQPGAGAPSPESGT